MLRVRPFTAVRPQPGDAPSVSSPPYDVVSGAEARRIAGDNPRSFMRVIRPEVDLPDDADPHGDDVYAMGRSNYERMLETGLLIRDDRPRMYLYRQVLEHKSQVGLVCCCHVDDYNSGIIRKHEKTRQDKEDDRTRHMLAINAHTGPVFLTYRDRPDIASLVAQDTNHRPLFHFNPRDGVTHTIWEIEASEPYVKAFANIPFAYVADGHHRSASAARAATARNTEAGGVDPDAEHNWFMSVLFPAGDLTILAYNRVVRDLGGHDAATVLDALANAGAVRAAESAAPRGPGRFCVYLDGAWHELAIPPESIDAADPVASLDVDLLQRRVLEPILGIGDPRTDERIDFVGGIRGTGELERRVNSGEAAIAFSLYPTSIHQLMAVADAGLIMPPKSTWFEPKLRSGLLVHELS